MKVKIQTMTTLLLMVVILLAGCGGCQSDKEIASPIETSPMITEELAAAAAALGSIDVAEQVASIKPPKTPDTFESDPYFYIRGIEYERLIDSHGGRGSTPIISFYTLDEKRYARSENGETAPTLDREIVEILTEGLSPLDAAKFLHLEGSYSEFAMEYAQQALDAAPDDYTTLHVWTYVQEDRVLQEQGLRRLLSMNPRSEQLYFDLGFLLLHGNSEDEGIDYLKKSAVLDPGYRRGAALGALGYFYQFTDIDLALAYYKEAQRYYESSSRRSAIDFIEKGAVQ